MHGWLTGWQFSWLGSCVCWPGRLTDDDVCMVVGFCASFLANIFGWPIAPSLYALKLSMFFGIWHNKIFQCCCSFFGVPLCSKYLYVCVCVCIYQCVHLWIFNLYYRGTCQENFILCILFIHSQLYIGVWTFECEYMCVGSQKCHRVSVLAKRFGLCFAVCVFLCSTFSLVFLPDRCPPDVWMYFIPFKFPLGFLSSLLHCFRTSFSLCFGLTVARIRFIGYHSFIRVVCFFLLEFYMFK